MTTQGMEHVTALEPGQLALPEDDEVFADADAPTAAAPAAAAPPPDATAVRAPVAPALGRSLPPLGRRPIIKTHGHPVRSRCRDHSARAARRVARSASRPA